MMDLPPGGGARGLGVESLSANEVCRKGELISIRSLLAGRFPPFAGDDEP